MVLLNAIISLLFLISKSRAYFEDASLTNSPSFAINNNSNAPDNFITFHHVASNEKRDEIETTTNVSIDGTRNDTNTSRLQTSVIRSDWDDWNRKLKFPNIDAEKEYKMSKLHLERGIFLFDFLRKFLSIIQPYDVPVDLLIDTIEKRMNASKLISEFLHLEAVFLAVVAVCCVFCCAIPGIELWLACRPIRKDYEPTRYPNTLTFFLALFASILGLGMITMIVCNETVAKSIEKFPMVAEAALQDLNDYHSSTTIQIRKCVSRSLDVASEAILADLDNIEDLLGKPVQTELSIETGLDIALEALIDLANATLRVSSNVEALLSESDRIRGLGKLLNIEIEDLQRNLESALKACTGSDRPLCTIIDFSGLRLTLRMDQLVRDDRLLRLRDFRRENLTETIRQARGEYLYIPQHIARNSLEIRNQIRREVNKMRARIFDEARNLEASNTELIKQLEFAKRLVDYTTPYIIVFEHIRWLIGVGTVLCILLIWLLLLGALCCRCSACEDKIRPTLLCGAFMTCLISIILWVVFIMTLVLSSHTEMLICRPLHDPNYSTIEAILETRVFMGKRLNLPLKDLLRKCRDNDAAYPAFGLGNTMKLEQLTAYWTWSSFSRIILKFKTELKALKIFTPYLQQQLQNLLYACGLNLTEHRIMIQGRILNKDLEALSDQLDKLTRQMNDRLTARSLETIVVNVQDLTSRRVKPLMKLQDTLVYKLAALELQVQPLQRQVNQSLSHLKTIQYYIDNQGDKIAQLRTKIYVDRLSNYLDQWRSHVLNEMGSGIAKCRPIWDVIEGIKLLLCSHFLGNLSGYWFATFLCAIVMIASTPVAHVLSLVYKNPQTIAKDANILPTRSEDPPNEANNEEGTWNTPEPPPPPPPEQENWQ